MFIIPQKTLNKFESRCVRCGKTIAPEQGYRTLYSSGSIKISGWACVQCIKRKI